MLVMKSKDWFPTRNLLLFLSELSIVEYNWSNTSQDVAFYSGTIDVEDFRLLNCVVNC